MKPSKIKKNILSTTTIKIDASGSRGTGFLFGFMIDKENLAPILVTNKHVLKDAKTIKLRISTSAQGDYETRGGIAEYLIKSGLEQMIIEHPDPRIDLAAICVGPIYNDLMGRKLFGYGNMFIETDIITQTELNEISVADDILMVGYPIGLSDDKHNLPIVRRGIIASDPNLPFDGKEQFLIDCACFPGSSGSPVVTKEHFSLTDTTGQILASKKRSALIGILWGGPVHTSKGEIIVQNVPTAAVPIPLIPQMVNLGYVINASKILDLKALLMEKTETSEINFEYSFLPA